MHENGQPGYEYDAGLNFNSKPQNVEFLSNILITGKTVSM